MKHNRQLQKVYNRSEPELYDTYYIFLDFLREYSSKQKDIIFATGQSGYYNKQIEQNGFGKLVLSQSDMEDAMFISECFGKHTHFGINNIPINYLTLLGTTEFNYAMQAFPAGIYEDVFQCENDHSFPIRPIVGETEEEFFVRVMEYQISNCESFPLDKKDEVLKRARRLAHNFCQHKNRVYLIPFSQIRNLKASFGDMLEMRNANISPEESKKAFDSIYTLEQLIQIYGINDADLYGNSNFTSEYGIAIYEQIQKNKITYIEVERKFDLIQRLAIRMGLPMGSVIPDNIEYTTKEEFHL